MMRNRLSLWAMLLGLVLVVGCGAGALPADDGKTPEHSVSPLPAVSQVSPLSLETESLARSPMPTPTPESLQLVVLHTNDNWGETEPCG